MDNDGTLDGNIEARLGISAPNKPNIRKNDRTATAIVAANRCGGVGHREGLVDREQCRALWELFDDTLKADPGSANMAMAICNVAHYAGHRIPETTAVFMETAHEVVPEPEYHTWYLTPGGIILKTEKDINSFLCFVDNNMHYDNRVLWPDLTGREQHEWYQAWVRGGKLHTHNNAEMQGLRGTDLSALADAAAVRAAVLRSPSLVLRRPANHTVTADQWPEPNRTLGF